MKAEDKNLLVLCGPNASGKTRLAVSCALHLHGEILSADSRQIYRGMDIGTGKDLLEYSTPSGTVPYHLIDIADPSELYTLFHYQQDCYTAITDIRQRKKLAILAGGTGLYIEAVLKYYRIPNVPEDFSLRQSLMKKSKGELTEKLRVQDAHLFATTDLSSKKRIIRALEIAAFAQGHEVQWGIEQPPDIRPVIIGVRWPRKELIKRINRRLNERLHNGMIDEVKNLLASGITVERFNYFGMEYKHIARYLGGYVPYATMVRELAHDIHKLAKRQMTYFRGMERRGLPIHWVEMADTEETLKIVKSYRFD